ncbi:proton-conducting membrane transporter [Bordetella genomosp. 9]|uniref:Proton-conducting membrane transporter n=1 Tax=Bordetella genomosp. 9 TaxID=1416803 RepID=A0A261R142_9BORD|nr:FAD-dependent oxidoreductase [Bordetella genomosp. 9]OZI18765.1 proton-conducting membrane transporter [Bordetella genomosp. 9]
MQRILVIGGGFAGLWSAAGAARTADRLGKAPHITLVNLDDQHSIRVRNYEDDLEPTRVPLRSVLEPIGVDLLVGEAIRIDTEQRSVQVRTGQGDQRCPYHKLILASGSHLVRPSIPGADACSFDVDTYAGALRLQRHIESLAAMPPGPGRYTAVVVGSGATGIELACELPRRLRQAARAGGHADAEAPVRVILMDRGASIGGHLGGAQPVIEQACRDLGIEPLTGVSVAGLDPDGVTLSNGKRIDAATVAWCGGMRASDLTACLAARRDAQGRVHVDPFMRVRGVPDVFAAGDVAHALIDGEHPSVMSCQHARPMGRYAGHNAVCELFGLEMLALDIDWYTNIIDLGPAGAVYAQGWDRLVVAKGAQAKATKQVINQQRIYPPLNGNRADILAAAAPDLQRPPELKPL